MSAPGLLMPGKPPAAAQTAGHGFGGFRLGPLTLALPMSALREVLPCPALLPLPCPAACVVGGINLRGVMVPVVDLRVLTQPARHAREAGSTSAAPRTAAGACVIIMEHAGRVLGLLSDGVTGVFQAVPGSLSRADVADPTAAVLAGSIRSAEDGQLLHLLSAPALAGLHQVPMVQDPEPRRSNDATAGASAAAPPVDVSVETTVGNTVERAPDEPAAAATSAVAATTKPMMLVRCGRVPLAIDAMGVYATLAHPQLQPSALATGHCLGVVEHAGRWMAAVDLLALCGLGRLDDQAGPPTGDASGRPSKRQAFVVQLEQGLVAFLVDEVLDVVSTQAGDVVTVPAFALPCPELFAGALPMTALAAEVVARAGSTAHQFLLVDASALKAHADLAGLAASNTGRAQSAPSQAAAQGAAQVAGRGTGGDDAPRAGHGQAHRRSMLTYMLGGETATPIEQVAEILPYEPAANVFAGPGALMGILVNRSRSIPVLCLSRLCAQQAPPVTAATSVLVVQDEGAWIGFAVPQLRSIESAVWPQLPAGETGIAPLRGTGLSAGTRDLAHVGAPGEKARLLRVLDLLALARQVQQTGKALAA